MRHPSLNLGEAPPPANQPAAPAGVGAVTQPTGQPALGLQPPPVPGSTTADTAPTAPSAAGAPAAPAPGPPPPPLPAPQQPAPGQTPPGPMQALLPPRGLACRIRHALW
ncbi:hypothetical protein A0H81_06085 [Grifola frondosa]|uniref:Uncharacterized protein n=1 Tax=Grifola frondosa TaxID=5627 RepID=A0A1C7MF10_GRIFR|nr:hypothetical protein A0H81_06085 [Grifola frondosa]